MEDIINKPNHYTTGTIECLDFIEAWEMDFKKGNVIKYVTRADFKGTKVQDLKKARFYLDRMIEEAEGELYD